MNLEEYQQALGAEPDSEELQALRNESLDHRRAADQAIAFERKLEAALKVEVADRVADAVLAQCFDRPQPARRWAWVAMAASAAAVAVLSYFSLADRSTIDDPLRVAFVNHMQHFEPRALTSDRELAYERMEAILAEAGLYPNEDAGPMTYVSRCIIGGERGLHLVHTDSSDRKTTILYIPNRTVADAGSFQMDEIPATMFASKTGAIAVFAHHGQAPGGLARGFAERGNLLALSTLSIP